MNVRLTVAASLSFLLVTGTVFAEQPWLADRRFGEGIGLRAGQFEFHPGISTEFGYDSNFFQRADDQKPDTIDPKPVDAWRLRITPSVTVETASQQDREHGTQPTGAAPMVEFNANAFASYSELFGSSQVTDQRNFDVGVGGKAVIAPQRPFGADVYADFIRNGEPSNLPGTDQTFDRGTIRGGAGATWRPGGGLFEWRLGYEASYNYFEDKPYTADQNLQQSILTQGRWRLLPRSGLVYDARYTFIHYTHEDSPQPNGDVVQARVGFAGLVTARTSFLVMGGWNSTFYEPNSKSTTYAQNYDGWVGQAELKYFVMAAPQGDSAQTGLSSITVGYTRDAENSYLGAFYTRDRGYLGFDYFLGGVFVANVQGGFSHYEFPAADANNASFSQQHVDASIFAEYRFSDTLGLNGTFLYDRTIGKGPNPDGVFVSGEPGTDTARYDNLEYTRIQAYIALRLFW
jgi:hypothetical protein